METIPESALDTIIATKARDMYRKEFLMMATELKELRARFNRREDLSITSTEDLELHHAAGWANGIRSRMRALGNGESIIIPGVGTQWTITRNF